MHLTVILLSLVLQCCEAYTIAGCDNNNSIFLREDEGRPFTLLCNNIGQHDTVCWGTSSSLIGCCDNVHSCRVYTGYDVRLERPYPGRSMLTFIGNIREQENNHFSCYRWGLQYPPTAACYLRIVYPGTPDPSSCSVRINATTWTVNGYCRIPKIYRSTGAYSCKWIEKHNGLTRSVTEPMTTTRFYDNSGRPYFRGECIFTEPLPTVEGRYVYSLWVSPGTQKHHVGNVQIEPEASEAVSLAAIAGGVGGAVALLIVVVIVTLAAISRRKKETSSQSHGISNTPNEEEFEEHINVIYGMDEASAANMHPVPSPRPVAVAWKVSSQNKTMEEHDDDGPSYQAISDTRREPPHCADADYTTVAENQGDVNGPPDVYAVVDKTAKKNRPQTLAVSPSTSQHGDVYAQVNKGTKARHSATGSARQTKENHGPEHVNTDSRKAKPTVKPKRGSKRKSADADGGAKRSSARGVRYNYENVGAFSPEHPSSPTINEVDMTQTPAADDEYNTLMISGRQPSESDKGQNPEYSHLGDI
ncbi:hypothetical protein BaRGS_00011599 [Batillaria attramentaria]|uniref:Uncharacterized protein n=1 Tax=Batillaria attramentaria TaxID=370345 RepID=A0ABD0LC17_9CAEN